MDATRDYHTKWSKSDRERQISYDITYVWNLKYDTNEHIYKTETDTEIRLVIAKGEVGRERDGLTVWGWKMQTITFRMDKQQGPTV